MRRASRLTVIIACAACVGCASATPRLDPADVARLTTTASAQPPGPIDSDAPLRVVVLPTRATTLDDAERALVTRLIAIQLERAGFEVVGSDGCAPEDLGAAGGASSGTADPTDARGSPGAAAPGLDALSRCLATAAAGARAHLAVIAEHARLGESDVVTLQAFDVARARPSRDAVFARALGEVAPALGPVLERLMARALSAFPPLRQPAIRAKYAQQRLDVCGDKLRWTFCTADGKAITENDMVRRFRAETSRGDLDSAEFDREIELTPWTMIGAGTALALVSMGTIVVVTSTPDGQQLAQATDDAWVVLPALGVSAALGLFIFGLIELDEGTRTDDGDPADHVLSLEVGRAAVAEFNASLLRRLVRENAAASAAAGAASVPTGLPPPGTLRLPYEELGFVP